MILMEIDIKIIFFTFFAQRKRKILDKTNVISFSRRKKINHFQCKIIIFFQSIEWILNRIYHLSKHNIKLLVIIYNLRWIIKYSIKSKANAIGVCPNVPYLNIETMIIFWEKQVLLNDIWTKNLFFSLQKLKQLYYLLFFVSIIMADQYELLRDNSYLY